MHPIARRISHCLELVRRGAETTENSEPARQTCLTPWNLWLLLSLVRQVERQRRVGSLLVAKLGVDMAAMSVAGALAHPSVPRYGLVPDHVAWNYRFHGRGCCLTNRMTGECVDVDFHDGVADWIDDWFFIRFLESLKKPDPIEGRLLELHPTIETVGLGFDQLLRDGILRRLPDSSVVRPLDDFLALADDIDGLSADMKDASRREFARRILGDCLPEPFVTDVSVPVHSRAAACLAERRRFLEERFAHPDSERLALVALCDLTTDSREYLERALKKPPCGTTSSALEIIVQRPREDWSELVFDLMCRADPAGDLPQPYVWTRCAKYLLQHGHRVDDVRSKFSKVGRRSLGDAAILALEHLPELAVPLFRRALRSDVPIDRITAAAALAILDLPWCHALLLEVLDQSCDQKATAEARAALMATPHPRLHRAVAEWEYAFPHEPESGPFISGSEMALQTRDATIRFEMEELHDRVIRLRAVCPPES